MEHITETHLACQLIIGDRFWMAGRMYRVVDVIVYDGRVTFTFRDFRNPDALLMRMVVPRNTPFEIQ